MSKFQDAKLEASEMAQWERTFTSRPDHQIWIRGTHLVEGEK